MQRCRARCEQRACCSRHRRRLEAAFRQCSKRRVLPLKGARALRKCLWAWGCTSPVLAHFRVYVHSKKSDFAGSYRYRLGVGWPARRGSQFRHAERPRGPGRACRTRRRRERRRNRSGGRNG
eukprot:1767724-Pleurochrysis_carterae.AAC.7